MVGQLRTCTRDGFTGLDYADQRFYASSYGRFATVDPTRRSAEPLDPTSWNRYLYVGGDPVNRIDPSGPYWADTACGSSWESEASLSGPCCDPGSRFFDPDPTPDPACYLDAGGEPGDGSGTKRRKLSPASQECQSLAAKIVSISQDIAKREIEIKLNPVDLPQSAPGPLRDSIEGHITIVNDLKSTLARRMRENSDKCDGPPPVTHPSPEPSRPPETLPSLGPIRNIGIWVGAGVALACGLFPEWCLPVLPIVLAP